jgi:Nucleotide exchange factor Fes1
MSAVQLACLLVHGSMLRIVLMHAARLQEPSEADLMKAAVTQFTTADATDTDKVDALARLRDLVRPIDNANGGHCEYALASLLDAVPSGARLS